MLGCQTDPYSGSLSVHYNHLLAAKNREYSKMKGRFTTRPRESRLAIKTEPSRFRSPHQHNFSRCFLPTDIHSSFHDRQSFAI